MTIRRRSTPLETEPIEPHMCSVHLRLEILGQVPFFIDLPAENVTQINDFFYEKGYTPGETIYFAGDPATCLYVVAAGKVKLMRHTLSGQDVLLDILTPGEFFGSLSMLGDEVYPDTAQAQTRGCMLEIGAADFQTILRRYPSVAITALNIVGQRLKEAHEMIRQLSAHPVDQRLANVLLKLAKKLGETKEEGLLIQVPLSRQDLAEMTGTTVETTSRVMSQFQKDGLLRTGRQWVAITNVPELESLAARE